MKITHVGIMIVALGLLSGCWYGSYPVPQPPISKTRACTGNDFGPAIVQPSRNKAKVGDTILLVAATGSFNPIQTYDSAQNTYTQPDVSTCPKIKLVRFLIAETVVGELSAEPYRLSVTLKAGEKGIPAASASNAGTTVDMPLSGQVVYSDDKTGQSSLVGGLPLPAFLSIDYP